VTTGTITGLVATASYDFQVRAITADGKASTPFTVGTSTGTATQVPGVQPQLTLTPAAGATPTTVVTASNLTAATSAGSTIWYTLQTDPAVPNPVVVGGSISDAALAFPAAGLPIDKQVIVHVAALNNQGLIETSTGTFAPGAVVTPPVAPVAKVAGGQTSATVSWVPVAGETYQVNVYQKGTTTKITPQPTGAQVSPYAVTLPKGSYTFSVTATNGSGSTESNKVDADVTGVVDTLAVSKATWKTGDFRVVGTSSSATGTVSVRTGSATGPVITGMSNIPLTAAVAPATGGTFDIRLRAGVPTVKPTPIWVTSSNGGVAGPITVANG
jgi:hypothetical protein